MSSAHILAPGSSAYGPARKDCSDCHDSHGGAKTTSDTPYPALLRVRDGDERVYSGDEYCDACHKNRVADLWPGLEVWRKTAHAEVTATASGTEIVCSVCHAPHGSSNRALVAMELAPPSVPMTVPVSGNDRSLCLACHANALASYPGVAVYEGSGHGSSVTTISIAAEWVTRLPEGSADSSRTVGQCQVCHASMGRDDGTGNPIPKLQKAEGSVACYRCHGVDSIISADIRSEYATAGAPVREIVASFAASSTATRYGVTHVYTRDTTSSAALLSPRQALDGKVGPTTAGDIDGDGDDEILVTRLGSPKATVLEATELSGLVSRDAPLMSEPSFIAIGDVLDSASITDPRNEIVTADGSTVRVYRWKSPGLEYLAAVPTSATITGLTIGDVAGAAGVESDDVVVTTAGDNPGDDRMYVLSRDGLDLQVVGDYVLAAEDPRSPAVGDFTQGGKLEVAVAFDDPTSDPLKVYDATGPLDLLSESGAGSRPARAALLADVLPGEPGVEAVVSVASPAGLARVDVFTQSGGALSATPASYALPANSNPGALDLGNVAGSGTKELVVALAGSFEARVSAGLAVIPVNGAGTALDSGEARTYAAGGVERAGGDASSSWVTIADVGDLGRSRHEVDAVKGAHVSTETASVQRHVACADCHNVHSSTSLVTGAPAAFGQILGVSGVALPDFDLKATIEDEYELCFKCHAGTRKGERRDVAAEFTASNASYHAVLDASTESTVPAETFVASTGLDNDSVIYCTSCHGNSDVAGAPGPHASNDAPLLRAPYAGAAADSSDALCFSCHRFDVYYTGSAEATLVLGSRFFESTGSRSLHAVHGANGSDPSALSCQACHKSHGSGEAHLLREDIGYDHNASGGGSCDNSCHTADVEYSGR